jgi:hypothetical protein
VHANGVDDSHAHRPFSEQPNVAIRELEISSIAQVERKALVIVVQRVEARRTDVAETHEIRVARLPGEHSANFARFVEGIAAPHAPVDAGPIDIAVRLRQERSRLSLQNTDGAGTHVAIDARGESEGEVQEPPGFGRRLRASISGNRQQRNDHDGIRQEPATTSHK